jgi:transcriptional regulator with XRE-family HTH domain
MFRAVGASVDPAALRAARERAGLTQHQLARLVGVAGGERVSRWELGTSEPRPDILVRLARVLKIRAAELLDVEAGADLRALRFAAGLSTDAVADAALISKRTYVRWESGRWTRMPDPAQARSLAAALNVSESALRDALERTRGTPPGARADR